MATALSGAQKDQGYDWLALQPVDMDDLVNKSSMSTGQR
jgi:hypothetical protein